MFSIRLAKNEHRALLLSCQDVPSNADSITVVQDFWPAKYILIPVNKTCAVLDAERDDSDVAWQLSPVRPVGTSSPFSVAVCSLAHCEPCQQVVGRAAALRADKCCHPQVRGGDGCGNVAGESSLSEQGK
jgi:hypothetical protein